MSESDYENTSFLAKKRSDVFKNGENFYEEIDMNQVGDPADAVSNKGTTTPASQPSAAGSKRYRVALVCLLMLVVFLLAAITFLWVNFTNLTARGDQLETKYKKVAEERDQFQKNRDDLQAMVSQLKEDFNHTEQTYYISTEKKSWSESREDCRRRGSDLVVIKSRAKQDFVEVFRRSDIVWIGANDRDREGVWKWVDGTQVTNGFWNKGEPNDIGDEDCAVLGHGKNPTSWVDVSCNRLYVWICEKKIDS